VSIILKALDREIEFFEGLVEDKSFDRDLSIQSLEIYSDIKKSLTPYKNDIIRMNVIEGMRDLSKADSLSRSLLDDFISVNDAFYVLDFAQAEAAIHALLAESLTLSEDELANELFTMSMTCNPVYIKEMVASSV
jgi:hypothetical protein